MKRRILTALTALVCNASSLAAQSGPITENLTVRLYSTQLISKLHVIPNNASMRLCETCRTQAATSVDIHWSQDSSNKLLVTGGATPTLLFDGQLQMTADSGKTEAGAGHWRIAASTDGLHVLLTVPTERYVMAVVSGEAAPNEPQESLKALAVTARSFALTNPQRHGAEGLCDSTHCQALRMAQVPDAVRQAVLDTAGETLWYAVHPVAGYFAQNCGGEAADAAQVWGGPHKPWLITHPDPYCRRQPALWHAEFTSQQLNVALGAEGWHVPEPLQSVRVTAKDNSGRALKLEFSGSGRKLELSAASLRFAIDRALGWDRIRSDWYTIRLASNGTIQLEGKGYGHGVGLCQTGAAEMAREGRNYREILAFYFPETSVRIGAADDGWKTYSGRGWTLRSTAINPAVLEAGNAAFARAQLLWQARTSVQPIVTLTPDTALFRQITSEPGWELASTRGSHITLQPLSVINRNTTLEKLLTHEFLHSFVESEANASTPLWLREGLVEALVGERGATANMPPAQIDSKLQHAGNLQEAQRAHQAACALVQDLVRRYGHASVRQWLRSSVPAGALAGK